MLKLPRLWRSPSEAVVVIVFLLLLIGAMNVFSASFVKAGQGREYQDSYYFLKRHLAFIAAGAMLTYTMYRADYHKLRKLLPLAVIATLVALAAVPFVGITVNGAKRWIGIGPLGTFQPSELAKLTVLMISAAYLGPRIDRNRPVTLQSVPFMLSLLFGGFVFLQPDMTTAGIIVMTCVILYIIVGLSRQQLLFLALIGVSGLGKLTYMASYRADRIIAWWDPWKYEQNIGYQTVQSLIAIGSGGFFGTGLGMGASKFYYLPEAHTDFAFAVLCQEAGFVGAITVLILFGMLAIYGGHIARQASDGFGKILSVGVIALLVGQAGVNIAMVTGLLPVIGVPLPFISYGGTSLIVSCFAVGLLLSVGRYTQMAQTTEQSAGLAPGGGKPPRPRLRLVDKKRLAKAESLDEG